MTYKDKDEVIFDLMDLIDSYRDFSHSAVFDQLKYNEPLEELHDRYIKILTSMVQGRTVGHLKLKEQE